MLDVARHYIDEPGVLTDEMVQLMEAAPFLNDRGQSELNQTLLDIGIANELLPRANQIFSLSAKIYGAPEKIEEQVDPAKAFSICHGGVYQAERFAESMNTPVRETIAALARIGAQVAIHFILTSEKPEIKSYAKTNLIYFALIEMLALGTRTNAYQYCYTDLQNTNPDFFRYRESIRPAVTFRPGEDERRFKGSIFFGETKIDHLVVALKGREFYYLGTDPPDPQGEE